MHDNDILHRDLKPENILFHEVCSSIFRALSKYAISDGQSIHHYSETPYAEHHSTPHLKLCKNSNTITRLIFGTLEF